jgi:hypothetical protein
VTEGWAEGWAEANHRWLSAAVVWTVARLTAAMSPGEPGEELASTRTALDEATAALPSPPGLDRLADAYGLTAFERDLLLLTAADELDARVGALCAAASGHDQPSFGLALGLLTDPHWSATTPQRPLRAARLVELGDGRLLQAPLHIDERVLHHLLGLAGPDRRLRPYLMPVGRPVAPLPASLASVGARLRENWAGPRRLVTLHGPEPRDLAAVVAAAAGDAPVYLVRAADVPAGVTDRETFAALWTREALLDGAVLVLDCHADRSPVASLVALLDVPVVVIAADPLPLGRPGVAIEVARPHRTEQRSLWRAVLNGQADQSAIEQATMQFDLGYTDIADAEGADATEGAGGLWGLCRVRSRARLDDLARRIEPRASWRDLVLPAEQTALLHDITAQVRGRSKVYHDWGFERMSQRGLGIGALFTGTSGTGKTLAAEVIAGELGLDLYLIDLSAVVSKYIGETEKNLRAVFDAADKGGAVLLFDEADALFGKRTEVRDSHDRYANIEVSYLLQRMESYRGLAVLTTNLRSAMDQAFLRRLRFVVHFPFPDTTQRAEIWRRIFPSEVPTHGLDPARLAQLNVAGGNIRNIALTAAFLAADAGESVTMAHVLRATRGEYAKAEKPLTAVETGGWV